MLTRADAIITLNSQKVGKPLPIVEAWANSTMVMLIYPDCVYSNVGVKIGDADNDTYSTIRWGVLHPVGGYWYIYLPKSAIPKAGETSYKVVAKDLKDSRHVCGEGVFRVYSGRFFDSADEAGNDDSSYMAYIQYEGVWYCVMVSEDDSGTLSFHINDTVTAPTEEESRTPFAYCKRTGLFHEVSIYRDESGTLALAVDEDGVEGDSASFARDANTGFYYRIEAEKDDSGTMSLQVGDRQ